MEKIQGVLARYLQHRPQDSKCTMLRTVASTSHVCLASRSFIHHQAPTPVDMHLRKYTLV